MKDINGTIFEISKGVKEFKIPKNITEINKMFLSDVYNLWVAISISLIEIGENVHSEC